jgi:hypothetical protein
MPYKVGGSNLPSNVKKMPKDKQKIWVSTWNSVYSDCVDGGGSASSCETKAFKVANGNAKKQMAQETMQTRSLFNRVWGGFLDSIGITDDEDRFDVDLKKAAQIMQKSGKVIRSTSMGRLREQLYYALDDSENGWAYPIDIFVDDDGKSLFSIVAQSGKLFSVPLSMSKDELTLGEWTQVKEEFTPIVQNSFSIIRQKDGTYRWFSIAGTTVLNRDGEIDSSELFDSFIKRAEKTGKYPRLDFYHQGSSDPKVWEFGTADYLARDGVCYLASGTFDEGNILAEKTIQAIQNSSDVWGNSIEFYAYSEPELILADPEVKIPVYKDGENTRISIVKEKDAAGLFTRIGINEEVKRIMDKKTKDALKLLFGDDEDGFKAFVEENDSINRTVKDDKLIHRKKKDAVVDPKDEEVDEDQEDQEDEESDADEDAEEDSAELVIDESVVQAITAQMVQSLEFRTLSEGIETIQKALADLIVAKEKDSQEISTLKKNNTQLAQRIQKLSQDETEKKSEWMQDLPSKRQTTVTYRPRDAHNSDEAEEDELELDLEAIAERTLANIPHAY